jgi:hypothetical protein
MAKLPCAERASPETWFWKIMTSEPWSSRVIPHFAVINPICNLTTAKVLGDAIPATLVSIADEVIG